jgi:spermidine synthase
LQSQANHSQDLIIIDAFSSDAIPTHLLTLEAFQLYQKKLKKNGGLLIHISNRHLNLTPVIKANAYILKDMLFKIEGEDNENTNEFGSTWLFLTKNPQWAEKVQNMKFDISTQSLLWTDNYSNIVPILN